MVAPTDHVLAVPDVPVTFKLYRRIDVSAVSGTGTVADGTWYPNGKVSLAWRGTRPSVNVYESMDDVLAIHGHGGGTELIPYVDAGPWWPFACRRERPSCAAGA